MSGLRTAFVLGAVIISAIAAAVFAIGYLVGAWKRGTVRAANDAIVALQTQVAALRDDITGLRADLKGVIAERDALRGLILVVGDKLPPALERAFTEIKELLRR